MKQVVQPMSNFDYDEFRNYLNNRDSLLVVNDDKLSSSRAEDQVMQEGLKYREAWSKVKVDNMRNQHEAQVEKKNVSKPVEEKEYHHRSSCW